MKFNQNQILLTVLGLLCTLGPTPSGSLDLGSRGPSRRKFGSGRPSKDKTKVSVAVVLPFSMFKTREYKKLIMSAALSLGGSPFEAKYDLSPYLEMVQPIPSPTEVLNKICDQVSRYSPHIFARGRHNFSPSRPFI